MSAVANPAPVVAPQPQPAPRVGGRKRWSVEQFVALCDAGFIAPDEHVELLEGEIILKMSQNFPHIDAVRAVAKALRAIFGEGFDVSQQLPIRTPDSVPEPDVLVLKGEWESFKGRNPRPEEVALVVEVADTSLAYDREEKSRIYAHAAFGEYWIVNLHDRLLEVRRRPLASGVYAETKVYGTEASIEVGATTLQVASLFP